MNCLLLVLNLHFKSILDVEHKPMKQIALVSSAIVLLVSVAVSPLIEPKDTQGELVTAFDEWLCNEIDGTIWDILFD